MSEDFFKQPILNSPYEYPDRHWLLDDDGQPTDQVMEYRRVAKYVTPVPKPKRRRRGKAEADRQMAMTLGDGVGISTAEQQYDPTSNINGIRQQVDR